MNITNKIDSVIERLVHKIGNSQARVPGFILGLSGTDSIIAFEVLSRAMAISSGRYATPYRLLGVHYRSPDKKPGAFEREALPWLKGRHGAAEIITATPLGGNHDPQRWADLQLRALNTVQSTSSHDHVRARDEEERYWVAGTINATEHALGKHSVSANAVSIQPIRSLWKTDVLQACEAIGVPKIIIENARIPDCLCGRDEIAAQHIELIDDILRHTIDVREHDPELLMMLMQWVANQKRENGFRQRIPYIV